MVFPRGCSLQAEMDLSGLCLAAVVVTFREAKFTSKIFWWHNMNILLPIAEFCHHDDFCLFVSRSLSSAKFPVVRFIIV